MKAWIVVSLAIAGGHLGCRLAEHWAGGPGGNRLVILHADDAGMCAAVNEATCEVLERGCVSSVSMLVPCPAAEEFARTCARHPDWDVGIHLALTSEWNTYRWGPILPRDRVPSLVDDEGRLHKDSDQVAQYARAAEAYAELCAQIEQAQTWGARLTHLDTHMHSLLSRPDLAEVYLRLAEEYRLPVLLPSRLEGRLQERYQGLEAVHGQLIARLRSSGLPIVQSVEVMNYYAEPDDKQGYHVDLLRRTRPGVSVVLVHCGVANEQLRSITPVAESLAADRRVFLSVQIAEELRELGLKVTTWRKLAARD